MEKWKDIPGYEGLYKVSDQGRVKSLDRYSLKNGKYRFKLTGRILKGGIEGKGYLSYCLSDNGNKKVIKGHRLVLEVFKGKCPKGKECNHKNGIKIDNRLENLEWVTKSDNHKHRHHILNKKIKSPWKGVYGKDNPFSITILQCDMKLKIIREWIGIREASRKTGIDQSSIGRVCKGIQGSAGGFIWKYK